MRIFSRLTFVAAAIALGGCSYPPAMPVRLPETPAAPTAGIEHHDGVFAGVGGTQLYEQSWKPQSPGGVRAVVVLVHGLKDHSERYRALAERLAQQGFSVHAFDQRGHGRSEGIRVWVDQFDDYVGDLDLLIAKVREAEPGLPVLLFAHSMGGAVATLYAIAHGPQLAGLALTGPALANDVSAVTVGGTKLVAALSPNAGVFQLDLHQMSRDPAVVSAGLEDPLVYQGGAGAHTGLELLRAMDRIQEHQGEITVPLLAMHGEADSVVPPAASKGLIEHARSTDKTLKLYPGLYHDLLHEPEKDREQVTADLVKWLSDHAPAAPAAAPAPAAPPKP